MNWLIDHHQLESGAFQENMAVSNKRMIGAVEGDISMTAYVLISLLESSNLLVPASEKINNAIREATAYLENQVAGDSIERVYDKAIVTYALALARSQSAAEANSNLMLEGQVEADSGAISFTPDAANYRGGNQPYWLTIRPAAIEVETSAYALLAQLALHDYQKAGRIALWLSKQQNYNGGFVSTQDTVVALQALAKYTQRPEFYNINMECHLRTRERSNAVRELTKGYHISNDNANIQEERDVSQTIGGTLEIESRGTGVAKANVQLRYNTEKSDIDTCPFHLNVTAEEGGGKLNITVCTRYLNPTKSTHMSIVDVGLYSGFKAIQKELNEMESASDLISIIEPGERSVIFYLDEIPNDQDFCFSFSAEAKAVVGNVQAAAVHVYDYYDPDESCTIFYKPGQGSALLSTLCFGNECICSGISREYCNVDPCPARYTKEELERTACSSYHGYALEIQIDEMESRGGFRIYNFTVIFPIKTGDDDVPESARRQLYINEGCTCPKVKRKNIGGKFLLVGEEEGLKSKYTTEQGVEGYRYFYGSTSNLEFWPSVRRLNRNHEVFDKLEEFKNDMITSACANEQF